MARSYQVSCPPATPALLADMTTLPGGRDVTILNAHATEPLYIGGDENQALNGTPLTTSTGLVLVAGAAISIPIDGNEKLYGVSGTSTVTVTAHVFRTNARA